MWPHVHAQMACYGFIWQRFKRICIESSNGEPENRHKLNARSSMVLHEKLTKKKCNWNVSCGPMFMHKMACFGFTWQRSKKICMESSNGEPKNRHKLNARSSMVLHEILTKKKCNWNVSCGRMFMHKWPLMDLFGKGSKKYASKALMGNQKIGTSWMQGLQWYSMRNSPKRNVIEMFHVVPGSCTNGLLWIYLSKGSEEYASNALMGNQKIGTSWMQGLQWYSMRNSPKRNVIEMFHVAPCSCTKWPVLDLLGTGPKEICIKSSNGEPKNRHKLNARSSMVLHEKLTKKKCNWNVSCGSLFMYKWPVIEWFE